MSENTNNRLYLMITITNRVMGATHFLDFYRAFGAPVVFTALGRGTASNDILNTLGLEATEKSVMFSVVTPAVKDVLMRELVDTMRIDRPGSGIAVCLHLSSVGGRTALNYLISGKSDAQPDMSVKEEELMNDSPYQLIVAITNTGYTDTVMEAASAAGARGGTVIHGRGERQQILRHGHFRGAGDDLPCDLLRQACRYHEVHHGKGRRPHRGADRDLLRAAGRHRRTVQHRKLSKKREPHGSLFCENRQKCMEILTGWPYRATIDRKTVFEVQSHDVE